MPLPTNLADLADYISGGDKAYDDKVDDAVSAFFARRMVDKRNAVKIDADDLATTLSNLLASDGAAAALAAKIGGTNQTLTALTGDIGFVKEVNHVIGVGTSTTSNTAGASLTVRAASGVGTGASGAMIVQSRAGNNGATSTNGSASGVLTLKTDIGGTTGTGTGGAGGISSLTTGTGGAATGNGTGGAGGALQLRTGAGGAAAGTGAAVGGAGGAADLTSGAGGAAAGTSAAGAGGAVTIASGAGGAKTGTGTANGGAAGAIAVTGAAGGATASTSPGTGGAGAGITLTAGAGGAASAGTANGGAGGSIILAAAAGGTSAGGTAGKDGAIIQRSPVLRKSTASTMTDTATIAVSAILAGLVKCTPTAAASYTMPTGTVLEAALPADIATGDSIEFILVNVATNDSFDITLVTAASGITLYGNLVVEANSATTKVSCGTFRAVRTGSNAYDVYRIR